MSACLLDSARVATGDGARLFDEVHRRHPVGREKRADERRAVERRQGFEVQERMRRSFGERAVAREKLGPSRTEEKDRRSQMLDQESYHRQRSIVALVQI